MNTASAPAKLRFEPLAETFGEVLRGSGDLDPRDLPRDEIIAACKRAGVVYFQGFGSTMAEFEELTNSYCQDWLTYQGGAHERKVLNPDGDHSVYSVNFYLGQKEQLKFELPLHCDMSYLKVSPVALYFYCVHPAASRGETMLCDGEAVYDQLSDSARKALHAQPIKYIRKYPPGNWEIRFGTDDMDEVRAFCRENDLELSVEEGTGTLITSYTVSAVPNSLFGNRPCFRNSILPVAKLEETGRDISIVRFEDGSPLSPELIAELREVTTRLTKLVPMAQGDFMFVDNMRVLHGRKGFDDERREVAIRMAKSLAW